MKKFINLIIENANTATSIKVPFQGYGQIGKTGLALVLFEKQKINNFNVLNYMKSFKTEIINKLLNTSRNYFRGLIIKQGQELLIFVWTGDIPHADLVDSLKKSILVPSLNYPVMYASSMNGNFSDDWCFPLVFTDNKVRSNLSQKHLKTFNFLKDIKKILNLSDEDWNFMLDSAW